MDNALPHREISLKAVTSKFLFCCVVSLFVFASQTIDAQHLHDDEEHAECSVCAYPASDDPAQPALEIQHPQVDGLGLSYIKTRAAATGTPTNQAPRAPPLQ